VPGRFVVLDEDIFVYYMLRCVFWVVSDLVLTLETSVGLFEVVCCMLCMVCRRWPVGTYFASLEAGGWVL
jgi:hypothetical protein